MVIYVANPLYDAVFKYLMEDERIAKTLLTALLKKKVVDVNHHAYDYEGKEVKVGMPDPFVESLQHDSIVVQIPLLHGRVNNRLEQMLSVFDQANVADDKKVIRVDDKQFEGDNDMEYIVRRLQSAAADPDMRYQMNAEDEFFKELESRDTLIMEKDKKLEEKDKKLEEKDKKLVEKEQEIKEQGSMLRTMILGMQKNGMSLVEIANMLGKTVEEIEELV